MSERSGPPPPEGRRDHYSYSVYADPEMAGAFDRMRFSGPIGTLVAESQAEVLASFTGTVEGREVLDVGTGTGRAALELARRGARVTGVDASAEMLKVARERAAAERLGVEFRVADAHHLPFEDAAFDQAVSLRVIMHTPDWRRCLGELCRVSRSTVVFDYPALRSVAAAQALWRRLVAMTGRQVEAYRVFSDRSIRRALAEQGFEVERVHRQFVLPIAMHKAIGSRRLTESTERLLEAVGLLRLFGSPVTVLGRRVGARVGTPR